MVTAHGNELKKDLKSGCHSAKGRRKMVIRAPKLRRQSYLKGIKIALLFVTHNYILLLLMRNFEEYVLYRLVLLAAGPSVIWLG